MIKVERINVYNFEDAIYGMRLPMMSHSKSDSRWNIDDRFDRHFIIGPHDLDLMKRLYKAGTEHRKYLRQIMCSLTITGPMFWWKEFDTYKIGTTANSTSTMHRIHSKEFTLDDFSTDHLNDGSIEVLNDVITWLNCQREWYLEDKDKKFWWQLIELLPSSYNQTRTVTMNYENVMNIINQRETHKLDYWRDFCNILRTLPYVKAIRGEE